ncbi:MAG TPA: hypothetical protein VE090_02430 [Methylomirabilota bacterium]|nr:hypothetical protein [Methylomirabilota bacterium]
MKPTISFTDFDKIDLRVGTVIDCTEKEGSEKLLRLTVDFGTDGTRIILSGIKKWYTPEDLKGKQFVFVFNLAPRKMMDEESQGMLLAAEGEKPEPLQTISQVPAGATIL